MKVLFKLPFLGITDKQYSAMPFGRQIEYRREIEAWKAGAKVVHISQKRRTSAAAMKEFRGLYQPKEYFTTFSDQPNYRDDSFVVFYK